MARSYTESVSFSLRAGDQRLKDPLVLDFGGPAAALSDVRFDFDLDGDGRKEQLPLLSGSGFLAFDRNANDTQGRLRASSIYLREDGRVGTLSQVDLRV